MSTTKMFHSVNERLRERRRRRPNEGGLQRKKIAFRSSESKGTAMDGDEEGVSAKRERQEHRRFALQSGGARRRPIFELDLGKRVRNLIGSIS